MRQWVRRASALHDELAALADIRHRWWWIVAGGAAVNFRAAGPYINSDAEPAADTFIGCAIAPHADWTIDAIARAHAIRGALRELDGEFPDQPLAVTIERGPRGARLVPSTLGVAAFAIGNVCWCAPLADTIEDEIALAEDLARVVAGVPPRVLVPLQRAAATPFVCISIGEEPRETARHGHRRAWVGSPAADRGPWIGSGRAAGETLVSTCHLVVDGYGHARVVAHVIAAVAQLANRLAATSGSNSNSNSASTSTNTTTSRRTADEASRLPPLEDVANGVALAICSFAIPTGTRALHLAYAIGRMLHRAAGEPGAVFSPTIQIPIAPGAADDPLRWRRRAVPTLTSVRFDDGVAEPFDAFAARTRERLAREAAGEGLSTRLVAAARGAPIPLSWKRSAIGVERPAWLDELAAVVGGRACVSRIELDVRIPHATAVSAPARTATASDPLGSCVATVIDDGNHAQLTLCGWGRALDVAVSDVLALMPD